MPKENDLERLQDRGGKHGGQGGMPRRSPTEADQGIVRDERGKNSRGIKNELQQVSRKDNDPRARSANPMGSADRRARCRRG